MSPTNAAQIINEAKRLERLQARRRKLRSELREVEASIRLSRKNLKALGRATERDPFDQVPPMRFEGVK